MENLLSRNQKVQHVPDSYILSPETRPGKLVIPSCTGIPVIELRRNIHSNREELVQMITKASQEFGFFQLTDHGVSEELIVDVLKVGEEFFQLPEEEKVRFYSEDRSKLSRLTTSVDYGREKVHFWRDKLQHSCHPFEEYVKDWPTSPTRYREVMGKYAVHLWELSLLLLDLICEGIGLEPGYLQSEMSTVQTMSINYYPKCPDPSLTLGLPKHSDPNLITILNQGSISGLQILRNKSWFAVDPIPDAFVVNIGHSLEVISNRKLKSVNHRVVTNPHVARTTVASFTSPSGDSRLSPASVSIDRSSHPLYRPFTYSDFVRTYVQDTHEGTHPMTRYESS